MMKISTCIFRACYKAQKVTMRFGKGGKIFMKVTSTEGQCFTQAQSPGSWDCPEFKIQEKSSKR